MAYVKKADREKETATQQALAVYQESIIRTLEEPEWFFSEVLRCEPLLKWQVKAVNAVLDVHRKAIKMPTVINHDALQGISVVSGHGTGKTQLLAAVGHIWIFIFPVLAVVTAPKQDQIKTRFMPRFRLLLRNALTSYKMTTKVDSLKVARFGNPDWGIQGETASEPENIAGYHDTPQLVMVDEASGQRLDAMYQTMEGALTTKGSVLVEIGNPTRSSGEFWAHHNKPNVMNDYFRMHVNYKDALKIISKKWVDRMRRKYGEDSPIFKIRVLGLFVEAERFQLIFYGWLAEAFEREVRDDGSIPRLVVSADVADGGDDFCVITTTLFYASFTVLLKQTKHSFPATESTIRLADECEKTFIEFKGDKTKDTIVVDAVGVGAGSAGTLVRRGYNVVPFKGGKQSDDPEEWRNRRVQSYLAMRNDYRDNKVIIDDNAFDDEEDRDEFFDQMASIRLKHDSDKEEDIETKEQHLKRTLKSPDRADSPMMAYTSEVPYEATEGFVLVNQETSIVVAGNGDW